MSAKNIRYNELDAIKELAPHYLNDIFSGDMVTREKLNEVIKKVNIIITILNERMGERMGE